MVEIWVKSCMLVYLVLAFNCCLTVTSLGQLQCWLDKGIDCHLSTRLSQFTNIYGIRPFKAGELYEKVGKNDRAMEAYRKGNAYRRGEEY